MKPSLQQRLARLALSQHTSEAARLLDTVSPEICAQILQREEPVLVGRVLAALAPHLAPTVLATLDGTSRAAALESMPAAVAAQLLRRLPNDARSTIVSDLPKDLGRRLRPMLRPREATAGALADPDALVLFADAPIKTALKSHRDALIRAQHDIPVVDQAHRLIGLVSADALLHADRNDTVSVVTRTNIQGLLDAATMAQIAAAPDWVSSHALPVVDASGGFVGLLHYETLRWIERQAASTRATQAPSTARALGDLFATAVGGVFEAIVATGGIRGAGKSDADG